MLDFVKMHGIGNDYIYIDLIKNENILEGYNIKDLVVKLSNRHFGIGSDGVILIKVSNIADFKMEMYNSDGSLGKMCGNGIRCVAKYLYDNNYIKNINQYIKIETLSGIKEVFLNVDNNNNLENVKVNMGKYSLSSDDVPFIPQNASNVIKLNVLDRILEGFCISVGNPHFVIITDDLENIDIGKYGSIISKDTHFPNETNVEFIQIIDKNTIKMKVWERGTGITLACGSGAVASQITAFLLGLTNKSVNVILDGGVLNVSVDKNTKTAFLTGSANTVFYGKINFKDLTI